MPDMDNCHVAFGYLTEGIDILRKIEMCGTPSGQPTKTVTLSQCGIVEGY